MTSWAARLASARRSIASMPAPHASQLRCPGPSRRRRPTPSRRVCACRASPRSRRPSGLAGKRGKHPPCPGADLPGDAADIRREHRGAPGHGLGHDHQRAVGLARHEKEVCRLVGSSEKPRVTAIVLVEKAQGPDRGVAFVALGADPDDRQPRIVAAGPERAQGGHRDVAALALPVGANEEKLERPRETLPRARVGQHVEIDAEGLRDGPHRRTAEIAGRPRGEHVGGIDRRRRMRRDPRLGGIGLPRHRPAVDLAQEGRGSIGDMEIRQVGPEPGDLVEKRRGHEPHHRVEPVEIRPGKVRGLWCPAHQPVERARPARGAEPGQPQPGAGLESAGREEGGAENARRSVLSWGVTKPTFRAEAACRDGRERAGRTSTFMDLAFSLRTPADAGARSRPRTRSRQGWLPAG